MGVVFGLPDRLEVGIAWSPYDVLEQPGPDSRGSGDVSVAIKKQVLEPSSSQPGWSIELGTQLDTSEAGHLEHRASPARDGSGVHGRGGVDVARADRLRSDVAGHGRGLEL